MLWLALPSTFTLIVGDVEEINPGYRLARRYWRKGLASEAARAVLNYIFGEKLFNSVVAIIEPEHLASFKVAEKAGFSSFDVLEFHGRPVRAIPANVRAMGENA